MLDLKKLEEALGFKLSNEDKNELIGWLSEKRKMEKILFLISNTSCIPHVRKPSDLQGLSVDANARFTEMSVFVDWLWRNEKIWISTIQCGIVFNFSITREDSILFVSNGKYYSPNECQEAAILYCFENGLI